jgi:ubiquinone/menaquinone biosynthesis C-methylase UbiE
MKIAAWDYTEHAKSYAARPNYAEAAIDKLVELVGVKKRKRHLVVDVGAGTANLTLMLLARGLRCIAVEPNQAMREIGMERTRNMTVKWRVGTGEATGLTERTADWVTFGSSFNTTDRTKALKETARILKSNGYFTCLWNHRDLNDPLQQKIEKLVRKLAPSYEGGVRREDQTDIIRSSKLFGSITYLEETQEVVRTPQQYVEAWRSTRNLALHAGPKLFEKILARIAEELKGMREIRMNYTTRSWTAQLLQA